MFNGLKTTIWLFFCISCLKIVDELVPRHNWSQLPCAPPFARSSRSSRCTSRTPPSCQCGRDRSPRRWCATPQASWATLRGVTCAPNDFCLFNMSYSKLLSLKNTTQNIISLLKPDSQKLKLLWNEVLHSSFSRWPRKSPLGFPNYKAKVPGRRPSCPWDLRGSSFPSIRRSKFANFPHVSTVRFSSLQSWKPRFYDI